MRQGAIMQLPVDRAYPQGKVLSPQREFGWSSELHTPPGGGPMSGDRDEWQTHLDDVPMLAYKIEQGPHTDIADGMIDPIFSQWVSDQMFPPTTVYHIDARRLLQSWAAASIYAYDSKWQQKHTICNDMQDVVALAASILRKAAVRSDFDRTENPMQLAGQLEMVGLIPNLLPNVVDASVLAIGTFWRQKLKDDRRGSLRKHLESECDCEWRVKTFNVFALDGLVDGPGPNEGSKSALLYKLEEYASKERRILVVPERAYISTNGSDDLMWYYLSLGFKKVEMEDSLFGSVLVYTGTSASLEDVPVDMNQHIMVSVNLWTGV